MSTNILTVTRPLILSDPISLHNPCPAQSVVRRIRRSDSETATFDVRISRSQNLDSSYYTSSPETPTGYASRRDPICSHFSPAGSQTRYDVDATYFLISQTNDSNPSSPWIVLLYRSVAVHRPSRVMVTGGLRTYELPLPS